MAIVVWPEDDAATDPSSTGSKSAWLARLARWPDLDRPRLAPQATISTEAWWLVVDGLGLRPLVATAVSGGTTAAGAAAELRARLLGAELPEPVLRGLEEATERLGGVSFAVRSSGVAEDLAEWSFAGQYLTELGVPPARLAQAYRACLASAWTENVAAYRAASMGNAVTADMHEPAMAVLVQPMVHDGDGWAGAALSDGVGGVTVEAVRGWGDQLMSGRADPLRWTVAAGEQADGPLVSGITDLVRRAERRLGHAIEVEFALPRGSGDPVVLQLRPHRPTGPVVADSDRLVAAQGTVNGHAVGEGTVSGPVCRLDHPDQIERLRDGGVLVTTSTDPRWVPLLSQVAAVVTDHGGATSHAAIVCRELGLLAVLGCGDATDRLDQDRMVEVRCEGSAGSVRVVS